MERGAFVHDGDAGCWVCTILCLPIGSAGKHASAEITLDGKQRVRLTLIMPGAWTGAQFEGFKHRCRNWILAADKASVIDHDRLAGLVSLGDVGRCGLREDPSACSERFRAGDLLGPDDDQRKDRTLDAPEESSFSPLSAGIASR